MSLIRDLKPFFHMARIFGFAPYSMTGSNISLSKISMIYSSFCILCYSYCLVKRVVLVINKEIDMKLILLTELRTSITVITLSSDIILCIIWNRKLQSSIVRMQKYDILTKLDTTGSFVVRSWLAIILIFIYFICLGWLTYIYESSDPVNNTLVYVILYTGLSFSVFKFTAVMASLLLRFRHLNRLLMTGLTSIVAEVDSNHRHLQLRDAWCLHGCLVAAAQDVNSLYTVQLLLWLTTLAFNATSRIYNLCNEDSFFNFVKIMREGSLAAIFILLLTVLAGVCHMTAAEANKVGENVFSPNSKFFGQHCTVKKEETFEIGQYFLLHRLHFSAAAGFVRVDLPLLQSIAGAMTTYLVILKAPNK